MRNQLFILNMYCSNHTGTNGVELTTIFYIQVLYKYYISKLD